MNLNATIIGQTISFILFVFFCMKYIWQPLNAVIERRQKEIADSLASAKEAKRDFELAKANAAEQLKIAKEKAQIIIDQANEQRLQILNKAKNTAEKESIKIIEEARTKINAECERVRSELRKQIAILIIAGVERIIKRSIDKDINNDILEKIVNEI